MTTLASFRSYLREHLDLSVDEMPNELVDSFFKDASNQVDGFTRDWNFQANIWELDTVAAQFTYDVTDLTDTSATGTFLPQKIEVVYDSDGVLLPYKGRAKTAAGQKTGKPTGWGDWGDSFTIIPKPDDVYTLQFFGYRRAADWIGDSPDGTEVSPYPQEFDEPLRQWALGRAYAQQEEGATATSYYDLANYNLGLLARKYQSIHPIQELRMSMGEQ